MPKSHDAKPRNKSRREKWQSFQKDLSNRVAQQQKHPEFVGPAYPLTARRKAARRLLREHYQQAVKAQRELEQALRTVGVKWRSLEKAVAELAGGKWTEVNNEMIENLVGAGGYTLKEAA